jgi:hypothetical protein
MTWKKIAFWTKIMMSIQAVGTFTQLALIFGNAQHVYNVVVTLIQLASLLLPIWFTDEDKDGNVDLFQKEITTTITSDSPINVKTETENK